MSATTSRAPISVPPSASTIPPGRLGYPLLLESLLNAPIVEKGAYDYFVHPLSDGIPVVTPALIAEATAGLCARLHETAPDVDKLVTAEAMGLPLVTAVSMRSGIPFVTARKRAYGLPNERIVTQETGYSTNALHLNGIEPGDRVAIIDDVISTGGTLRALAGGIREAGAEVDAVAAVFTKDPDLGPLATRLGCPVSALVSCTVVRDDDPRDDRGRPHKQVVVRGIDLGAHPQ